MPKRQVYTQKYAIQRNSGPSTGKSMAWTRRNLSQSGLGESRLPCICFINMSAQSRYLVGRLRSTKNCYVTAAVWCNCTAAYEALLCAKPLLQVSSFSGVDDGGSMLHQSDEKILQVYIKCHVPKDGNLRSNRHTNLRSRDGCHGTMVTFDLLVILITKV
jgi:hypothetical protein